MQIACGGPGGKSMPMYILFQYFSENMKNLKFSPWGLQKEYLA